MGMEQAADWSQEARSHSSSNALNDLENRKSDGSILSVRHRTTFDYGGPVWNSVNTLHMEPRNFPNQETISAEVKVLPKASLRRYDDLFGNIAHHFEIIRNHEKLEIESSIKVRNQVLDVSEEGKSGELEQLDYTKYHETIWQYLQESHWISMSPQIWRQALDLTNGITSIFGKASAIMGWIHSEFTYVTGITNVNTHPDEVFELKKGVCQDFSHVMIGLCRSVGVPARYASGYLYNGPRDTLIGSQASHAWCEVFLPQDGWIGFDPTNNNLADDRYVKIAIGRDYQDVPPLRGSYYGSEHCRMEVHVLVERV